MKIVFNLIGNSFSNCDAVQKIQWAGDSKPSNACAVLIFSNTKCKNTDVGRKLQARGPANNRFGRHRPPSNSGTAAVRLNGNSEAGLKGDVHPGRIVCGFRPDQVKFDDHRERQLAAATLGAQIIRASWMNGCLYCSKFDGFAF
jgi:hypothetical protein